MQTYFPRQLGKSYTGAEIISGILDEITTAYTEVEVAMKPLTEAALQIEKRDKGRGKIQNHGPRAGSTFDRRGRRRY